MLHTLRTPHAFLDRFIGIEGDLMEKIIRSSNGRVSPSVDVIFHVHYHCHSPARIKRINTPALSRKGRDGQQQKVPFFGIKY